MSRNTDQTAARSEAALGAAMLETLQAQRGHGQYPLTLAELARLTAPDTRPQQALAAVRKRLFSSGAIVARAGRIDAPVAAIEDLELLAGSAITLEFALRSMQTASMRARTVADLGSRLTSTAKFKDVFKRAVNEQVEREQTPPGVGWIVDRKPKLFLLEEIRPRWLRQRLTAGNDGKAALRQPAVPAEATASAEKPEDFAICFEKAFDQLDRQKGSHNFVSLLDLRRRLSDIPRHRFDTGLHQLRIAGRFTLSAAESVSGIPVEQREAGIEEAGSLLLHVSRRAP